VHEIAVERFMGLPSGAALDLCGSGSGGTSRARALSPPSRFRVLALGVSGCAGRLAVAGTPLSLAPPGPRPTARGGQAVGPRGIRRPAAGRQLEERTGAAVGLADEASGGSHVADVDGLFESLELDFAGLHGEWKVTRKVPDHVPSVDLEASQRAPVCVLSAP
jgi:hypothetical protein